MAAGRLLEIPKDAFDRAAKRYNKTYKSLEEDVDIVEQWLSTQPHLPEILERPAIRNFLLSNKCSIERTKQKIDCYYTIRSKIPEIYDICNPKRLNMQEILDSAYLIPLPQQTEDLHRLYIVKFRDVEKATTIDFNSLFALSQIVQEVRLKEDCMLGDIIVYDFSNVTMDTLLRLTPTVLIKVIACYEKVYSMPMQALHIINSPSFVNYVTKLLKGILKPKLFERIHVHEGDSVMLELFPKSIIPKDYGGDEKSLDELTNMWKMKFQEYGERFDKLDMIRVDENLRPEKLVNAEEFGFHGNFKKLDVD